jgi:hypothetical protein
MPPQPQKPKRSFSILDQAENISFSAAAPFGIGIFGSQGSGKTTLWSTFPKPIFACMCSGELSRPGELKSITKEVRKQIKCLNLTHCEQVNEVTEAVASSEFKTVVLENLTSFSDLCLKQIMGVESIPPQLSWGFATQQQWGQHGMLVKEILRSMLNLEKYVVIVSQERWFDPPENSTGEDTSSGISKLGPATTPTIAGWLVQSLDYSIQTYIRDKEVEKEVVIANKKKMMKVKTGEHEFCAYLPYTTNKMTKFRLPFGQKPTNVLVNPTFDKIAALVSD